MINKRPIDILLVEDSESDVRLTKEALLDAKAKTQLHVVTDGVEAISFLRRRPPYADAPRPDLILLDLNMPRKDGREVLNEIKSDADLKTIPVVVLTTSDADRDLSMCYKSHCNCYITKPIELDDFLRVVRSVDNYWGDIVQLYKGNSP